MDKPLNSIRRFIMAEVFRDQYVISKWEDEACKRLRHWFLAWGVVLERLQYSNGKRQGHDPAFPHEYQLGWGSRNRKRYSTFVHFTDGFINSGLIIEKESQVSITPSDRGPWSRKYSTGAVGIDEERTEEVSMKTSKSERYTVSANLEIINTTTTKAEASIGDIASASAENTTTITASAAFGTESETSKSEETKETIKTVIKVPPYSETLLTVERVRTKEITEIIETGYLDLSMKFDLWDPVVTGKRPYLKNSRAGKDVIIRSDSVRDLLDLVEGQRRVEYPNMENFLSDAQKWRSHRFGGNSKEDWNMWDDCLMTYRWFNDPENRKVELRRQRVRDYESAGEIRTREV